MQETDIVRRRRWPQLLVGVLLVLADLFMVLVFVEGASDSSDPDGRTAGLIIVGVVIALLSWLAFLSMRAFVRRGRPERLTAPGNAPTGRRVGGTIIAVVFYGIALLIAGLEAVDMAHGDFSGTGGLTGAAVCAAIGSLGLTMRRTPSAAQRGELLAAYNQAMQRQHQDRAPFATVPQQASRPSWLQVPVDRTATYREFLSEAWWRGLVGSLVLGAALIWGMTRVDTDSTWVLFLLIPLVAVAIALVVFFIFLPYGIQLAGGVLTVGAFGVPRGGRVWRRQDLPLDEIVAWTVRPRVRRERFQIPRSPFPDGNPQTPPLGKGVAPWGSFVGPGVRDVLVVRVDPARVPATMPAVVMSGYTVEDSSRSLRDTGVYLIGTRHADRLARTLDKAVPSRRALT